MPEPRSELVEVEDRRELPVLLMEKLAGGDETVVDQAVRLDFVVYRLPLCGGRFDAEPQGLHGRNHAVLSI